MVAKENPNVDAIEVDESEITTNTNGSNGMTETDNAQEEATLVTYQKMAAFTTLKRADARRSIGCHKSNLTRTKDAADRAVTAVADMPCLATIKNMERCLEAYYTKADTMELAYEYLLIVERWEREVREIHNLMEPMRDKWLPSNAQATSPLSQPLRPGGHDQGGKIKIRADLKPRELSEDSTPVEFSTWCKEYTVYHSASNLQLASKQEQ